MSRRRKQQIKVYSSRPGFEVVRRISHAQALSLEGRGVLRRELSQSGDTLGFRLIGNFAISQESEDESEA